MVELLLVGQKLTFTLRKGGKFQDGTDFNAQAVKWNLDKQRTMPASTIAIITSVDIVDDYTVLQLKTGLGATLHGLAGDSVHPDSPFADIRVRQAAEHAIVPVAVPAFIRTAAFYRGRLPLWRTLRWALIAPTVNVLKRSKLPPEELKSLRERLFYMIDNIDEQYRFLPLKDIPATKEFGLAPFYSDWLAHPDRLLI